jgi:hypothetical protein
LVLYFLTLSLAAFILTDNYLLTFLATLGICAAISFTACFLVLWYFSSRPAKREREILVLPEVPPPLPERMDIEYELDLADAVALHIYRYEHNPIIARHQKLRRILILFSAISGAAVTVTLAVVFGAEYYGSTALIAFVSALFWAYYFYFPRITRGSLSRASVKQGNLQGKHRLAVTEDGIRDVSGAGESADVWKDISQLESRGEYIILFGQAWNPYLVPKKAFKGLEELGLFENYLRSRFVRSLKNKAYRTYSEWGPQRRIPREMRLAAEIPEIEVQTRAAWMSEFEKINRDMEKMAEQLGDTIDPVEAFSSAFKQLYPWMDEDSILKTRSEIMYIRAHEG